MAYRIDMVCDDAPWMRDEGNECDVKMVCIGGVAWCDSDIWFARDSLFCAEWFGTDKKVLVVPEDVQVCRKMLEFLYKDSMVVNTRPYASRVFALMMSLGIKVEDVLVNEVGEVYSCKVIYSRCE